MSVSLPSQPAGRPFRGISAEDRAIAWVARHWLLLANSFLALYAGGAFLPPLLFTFGMPSLASFIFGLYSVVCHQEPGRSFFLFGHQVAFCQRDVAIYLTMALAGLVYALPRGRIPSLDWKLYALASVPMAIDGATQLLGMRESNWELRLATGAVFGLATVWTLYPIVDRGMRPLHRLGSEDSQPSGN